METRKIEKIIIIGSGPAGLTAGIYSARANLSPLVIEGAVFGGQLMQTTLVENFPGFPDGIMGPDLMLNMKKQAENQGARFVSGDVTEVNLLKKPFEVSVWNEKYFAESIIVATGAKAKWLPLESAERLRGRGVSACATCDGPFFKDKDILVVGGGDTALEEASFLSKFARKIYILNIMDKLNASQAMQERIKGKSQFEVILESEVKEILGSNLVEGVVVRNLKTGAERNILVEGVFIAIGHTPGSNIFKNQLDILQGGQIKDFGNCKTSIPGVFVAGDVSDTKYWQAVIASASGCMASMEAEKYLQEIE